MPFPAPLLPRRTGAGRRPRRRPRAAERPAFSERSAHHDLLCRTVEIRITATGNIAKITKAMKMVAAAKLRAVQDKNELARPFTDGARDFLEPYAEVMDEIPESEVLKHVIVPITGDRGLCGGINTNIAKYVKAMVDQDSNDEIAVIAVGQKGEDGVQKFVPTDQFVVSFRDVGGKFPMSFTQACVVAEDIVTQDYDKMTMVYTNYKNALVQTPMSFTVPSKSFMEDNPEKLEVRRQKPQRCRCRQRLLDAGTADLRWVRCLLGGTGVRVRHGQRGDALDAGPVRVPGCRSAERLHSGHDDVDRGGADVGDGELDEQRDGAHRDAHDRVQQGPPGQDHQRAD